MSNSSYRQIIREVAINIQENDPEKYERYKAICDRYIDNKVKLNRYGNCIMCGGAFLTKQPYQKYCSEKCKDRYTRRIHDARRRKKGFYPIINNVFPEDADVDYHHVHPFLSFVVPLPRKNHQEGNGNLKQHLDVANKWVTFYFGLDTVDFLY